MIHTYMLIYIYSMTRTYTVLCMCVIPLSLLYIDCSTLFFSFSRSARSGALLLLGLGGLRSAPLLFSPTGTPLILVPVVVPSPAAVVPRVPVGIVVPELIAACTCP